MEATTAPSQQLRAPGSRPPRDWLHRAYGALPLSLVAWTASLFGVHFAVSAAVRIACDGWLWLWLLLDALNSLLFAVVPTVVVFLQRAAMRDIGSLSQSLRPDAPPIDALVEEVVRVPRALLFALSAIVALYFASMPVADPTFYGELVHARPGGGQLTFLVLRSALMGWLVGHAAAAELWLTVVFRRVGRRAVRVDLHRMEPLAVFARRGLRSAFAWTLCVSLVSLFWLASAAATANAVIIALTVVLVGVEVVQSMAGIRTAIRQAKDARLAEIDARIEAEAARNLEPPSGAPVDARLANLVAYRGQVAFVREWPFGGAAIVRFALVAALGLGSWLGGALVERALDAILR